ncbi:O-succinylbenzoic acid--CoA ligase [Alteromonadaceae bacterium 2753L.S.0a.02]|nr:O-succinylbenzoic acid--CoA ligase [Alteromonadaceae bacterium 2753L.S.0a.02]
MNVACPLARAAAVAGEKPFLESAQETLSFGQFYERVSGVSVELKNIGRGAPLLVPVRNTIESLVNLFAAMNAGHVAVPIYADLPVQRIISLEKNLGLKRLDLHNLMLKAAHSSLSQQTFADTAPVLGIFTSGSSGVPKLVVHSYQSLLSNAAACNSLIPLAPLSRTLLSLPIYHIGGFAQVLRALLSATTLVINGVVEDGKNLFKQRISHCSMVSTQLQRLLLNFKPLPELQAVLLGGGPCNAELLDRGKQLGLPLCPTYGMSEAASQVFTTNTSGKQCLIPGVELQLSPENEILLRGKNLFLGYWRAGKIDNGRDGDGWFHTRDLAERRDGKWHLTGRLDNQFISGGKNIQPEEIEYGLLNQSEIVRAVVVPVEHSEFGKVPFAFVELNRGELTDSFRKHIIDTLKRQLPGHLVPRYYAALAASGSLKPSRAELTRRAALILREISLL